MNMINMKVGGKMEKPVTIENYNLNWATEFEQEKAKIKEVLKEEVITNETRL
ncbi:hypothetical protein ABE132_18325 [Peribacillus simplex]|uniref:hypothetical protein n=1 Tax=Peribacillus simplex TaxID=1478 RepID=UPI003D286A12